MPWRTHLQRLGAAALSAILPAHCPGCDAEVPQPDALCADCFSQARFVLDPCCPRCASPFPHAQPGDARLCAFCEAEPPPWDTARAAFVYDPFSRRLILPLKYADRTENARVLGLHMARAAPALLAAADMLVPVPLHRSRLLSRRYNQAALLARAVRRAAGPGGPPLLVDALLRLRATRKLAHQNAAMRRVELAGAIGVRHPAAVRGRRVVLVDDVLTTGSTARACAVALRDAGAVSVGLLVAARTEAPRHEPGEGEPGRRGPHLPTAPEDQT